jgi:hypothetical protein
MRDPGHRFGDRVAWRAGENNHGPHRKAPQPLDQRDALQLEK